ncbi:MAG: endolytic transglycosylase MltG [Halofilum sp. (in: g-proteobacteria)]
MAERRKKTWLAGLVALLLSVGGGVAAVDFFRFLHGPVQLDEAETVTFSIESGASVRRIAERLVERELIDRPLYFRLTARFRGDARRIQAGEYVIESGMTPYRLLEKFVRGDVKQYWFSVIPGWTFDEMMTALRRNDAVEHTLDGLSPEEIMEELGYPDQHPEGRFYPDTYQFSRGRTDRELLERAYERMQTVLEQEWNDRGEDLPLDDAYEALILASIVERETGVPDERARIAGVFVERLERDMRLQTDPTVIYGMGDDYDGDIRYRDLRENTPYNTYTRAGLTPTPIAMPSRASIHATLHPERRGELYFVSTGDGEHVFSESLEEHNRAVVKYQLGGDESRLRIDRRDNDDGTE